MNRVNNTLIYIDTVRENNSLILFLVEKSLANINCLLACLYVRTSLIGPRIMREQKALLSINLDQS